jgi:type VI secretion system ImpC/EvpB family protein
MKSKPGGAVQKRELPFVVGVMSDLSGDRGTLFPSFSDRRFVSVDLDNFDDFLAKINPTLTLVVDNVIDPAGGPLTIKLAFSHLDDFRPERIDEQVEPLCTLLQSREACGKQQIGQNAIRLAEIDDLLSRQLDRILHDPEFQRLEASWRGLHYLVLQTETSEMLKIKVLDVSKQEMAKDLRRAVEFDQSILFKKVVEDEWGDFSGEPFGALIGDYYFDHHPTDIELLEGIAHIAAAAQAPFIAGAAPGLLGMDSWQELGKPRDLAKILLTPEYTAWRAAFRQSEDARYTGLTMPRILLRNPYLAPPIPTEIFAYRETINPHHPDSLLWGNAAYAFAACLTTAFARYGWCAHIRGYEGGGLVEGLPSYTLFSDQGEVVTQCPTEIAITALNSP